MQRRKSTHVRKPHVVQVQPGGERLQLHLDRDQAGVGDVFGIWERVSGKQKYVCVLGAELVFVSVYLDRVWGTSALASRLKRRRQRKQNQMHPVDLNVSRRSSCVYPSHKKLAAVNLKE